MIYAKIVSLLFNARTNMHIAHLQTKSYAEHKALDEFYSAVVDLADRFAECVQGQHGVITGYTMGTLHEGSAEEFLSDNLSMLQLFRASLDSATEGHLIQIIDDCIELYTSTIYKLTILS